MSWVIRGCELSQKKVRAPQGRSGVSELHMLGPYLKYQSTTNNQAEQHNHHSQPGQVP